MRLGANAILSVSLASCKAVALSKKMPLFKYLSNEKTLPLPLMNIIYGGTHANNSLRIQEFIIRPDKPKNFKEALNMCFLVIQKLKSFLNEEKLSKSTE